MRWIAAIALTACTQAAPDPLPAFEYPSCDARIDYRINRIEAPANSTEAMAWALDLDRDFEPDNRLGKVNSALVGVVGEESNWHQRAVDDGRLAWVVSIEECAAPDGASYTRVGSHRIRADGSLESGGAAAINTGELGYAADGEGLFPLSAFGELPSNADGPVTWVQGRGLAASLVVDGDELEGIIAIGLSEPDVLAVLIPTFAAGMSRVMSDDGCLDECVPESDGYYLSEIFDDDANGQISDAELRASPLVTTLSEPDLDLVGAYAGAPVYWPNQDGETDHLSAGLRITAQRVGY